MYKQSKDVALDSFFEMSEKKYIYSLYVDARVRACVCPRIFCSRSHLFTCFKYIFHTQTLDATMRQILKLYKWKVAAKVSKTVKSINEKP